MTVPDLDGLPQAREAAAAEADDLSALLADGEPIVFRGAASDWPLVAAARQGPAALNEYLLARDRGAPVPVMEAPPASGGRFGYAADLREFTFTKRSRPLRETLDRILRCAADPAGPILAIQMLPLDSQLPDIVRENPMPLVPASATPKLWLGGPVKTQIHNDRDHNLAVVIAGSRRFVLFPPDQVTNLYIGPIETPPPLSLVDPEAPDFTSFPRFAEALAAARVAHLAPGDALLMPRYWWHHVTSRHGYNAMVNYWWGDRPAGFEDPHTLFLAALLAIKALPPGERDYWQEMFATHVFSGDGHGAAHLPPARQGVLGPHTPALRAALRQKLRAAVLKA